jgi:hypothetical protein
MTPPRIPLEPITLTEFGETLARYPGSSRDGGDHEHMRDCVGIHTCCDGFCDLRAVSQTHNIILCRACKLRVVIPATVMTYGQLRAHFEKFQPKPPELSTVVPTL